jgi:hypothetical protein
MIAQCAGFLELRNNGFGGNIPSELGLLIRLRDELDLSHNRLSGQIPSDLGRLVELRKWWPCEVDACFSDNSLTRIYTLWYYRRSEATAQSLVRTNSSGSLSTNQADFDPN